MITELTKEQEARIPEIVQKWTKIGLRTLTIDPTEAEKAICKAYKVAGYKPPKDIVFVRSPWELVFAPSMWVNELVEPLNPDIEKRFKQDALNQLSNVVYGNGNAWLSYYDYFIEVCNVKLPKLAGLLEVAHHCHWWLSYENVAFVSDFPTQINRDDRFRLHSTSTAALAYPDGFSIYSVHGVRIPEDIILRPDSITVKRIESESNAEIRRVMVEKYGQGRYLKDSGAKLIGSDMWGELYRKELPGDEPLVMVKVTDATEVDNDYFLRVPPNITTPLEAVAWTFYSDPPNYAPEIQT